MSLSILLVNKKFLSWPKSGLSWTIGESLSDGLWLTLQIQYTLRKAKFFTLILLIMSVSFYQQWSTWLESLGGRNRAIPEEHNSGTCGLSTLWRASRQSDNDRKRCPKASRQSREESRACPRDSRGAGQQKILLSARVLFWHHSQLLLWHLSNLTLTSLTSLLTPILTSTDFRLGFHSSTSYSWMRSLSGLSPLAPQ